MGIALAAAHLKRRSRLDHVFYLGFQDRYIAGRMPPESTRRRQP